MRKDKKIENELNQLISPLSPTYATCASVYEYI